MRYLKLGLLISMFWTCSACRVVRLYNLKDEQIPLPAGEQASWNAFDSIYKTVYCPADWNGKDTYLKVQEFVVIRASPCCQKKFRHLLYDFWKKHPE